MAKADSSAAGKACQDDTPDKAEEMVVEAPGPITLPSKLVIGEVATLRPWLNDVFQTETGVTIDASAVASVDVAGLQLLVAFFNSMASESQSITWQNPSITLVEMTELSDLADALGLNEDTEMEEDSGEDDGLLPVF